jgi:hypothetical protein
MTQAAERKAERQRLIAEAQARVPSWLKPEQPVAPVGHSCDPPPMPVPPNRPPAALPVEASRQTIQIAQDFNRSHTFQVQVPDVSEIDKAEVARLRGQFGQIPDLWLRQIALAAVLHEEGMGSHLGAIGLSVALAGIAELEVSPAYWQTVGELVAELPAAVAAPWCNIDTISRKVLAVALECFEALLPQHPGHATPIARALGLPVDAAVMAAANSTRTSIVHRVEAAGSSAELVERVSEWAAAAPHERAGYAQLFTSIVRPAMVLLGVLPALGARPR